MTMIIDDLIEKTCDKISTNVNISCFPLNLDGSAFVRDFGEDPIGSLRESMFGSKEVAAEAGRWGVEAAAFNAVAKVDQEV